MSPAVGCAALVLLVLLAAAPALAQIDPEPRLNLELGVAAPLRGEGFVSGYGFILWNRPKLFDEDLYLRVVFAPTFLMSELVFDKWPAEGHAIVPGAIGENITVQGFEWSAVIPGRHLRLGDTVVLQVTRFTSPCTNIMPVFKGGDYSRVSEKRHPGWSRVYARVLTTGSISQGDPVRLLSAAEIAEGTATPSR